MSNKTINELTPEQEAQLEVYRDKWSTVGTSTEPTNQKRAEKNLRAAYVSAGVKEPDHVLFFASPKAAWVARCVLKQEESRLVTKLQSKEFVYEEIERISKLPTFKPSQIDYSEVCYGQHDAPWLGFYNYFQEVLGVSECDRLQPLMDAAQDVNWFLPYEKVCIVSEKPVVCSLVNNKLHNEKGPAYGFSDGTELYALNGVAVPKEYVMTSADKLDVNLVLKEKNAEIRRELVRKIGTERLCSELGSETIDRASFTTTDPNTGTATTHTYDLILLNLGDNRRRPYLKMTNPSIGTIHIEGVPPNTKTVKEALQFRMGTEDFVFPVTLT